MKYFKIGTYLLLLTSASHLIGHFLMLPHFHLRNNFTGKVPANETEQKLLQLMNEYHREVGLSSISMMDIQDGLSLCYALFFAWLGLINLLVYKNFRYQPELQKKITVLNSIALSVGVLISALYFFWLPTISFGLAAIFFILDFRTPPKRRRYR